MGRKIKLTGEQAKELISEAAKSYDKILASMYSIVCVINDVANCLMVDTYAELKKSKYYKQSVKKNANLAMNTYNMWCKKRIEELDDRACLWMDLANAVADGVSPHIDRWRYAMELCLQRHKVEDAHLKAMIMVTSSMLEYASVFYDRFIDGMKNGAFQVKFIKKEFREFKIDNVYKAWKKVKNAICIQPEDDEIDLNKDEMVCLGYDVVDRYLTDADNFNMAAETAISYNKEIAEKYEKRHKYE